jgi:cobalt-zinc-cadmium efflux system protein
MNVLMKQASNHTHHQMGRPGQRKRLALVLFLSSLFMVVEAVAGWLTHSLALWADAGHMLTDVAALSLSSFAMWMATRKSTPEKTYGYHRAEILAAVVNAVVLLALAGWIVYEAFDRFSQPPDVPGLPVLVVGAVGLLVNAMSVWLLTGTAGTSLNMRSAYLEVLSDAISSVGVMPGGGVIWLTGWLMIDPLLSIGISGFIIWRTWGLLSQAINILMEGVPPHLDAREVGTAMIGVAGVKDVHDLHVWTITSGRDAVSAHVVVPKGQDRDGILLKLEQVLHDRFGLDHITLQIVEEREEYIRPQSQFL